MVFQCCAASYSGDKQKIILSVIAFSIRCSTQIAISLRCNVKKTPGYICKHSMQLGQTCSIFWDCFLKIQMYPFTGLLQGT